MTSTEWLLDNVDLATNTATYRRVKYATPAMVERAAQECSARASWWAKRCITCPGPPIRRLAMVASKWVAANGDKFRDIWAEAEARLREGRLPPGWALCCPCGGRLSHGRCLRCNRRPSVANATAWAPGKGP